MSKCKPSQTSTLKTLEDHDVIFQDVPESNGVKRTLRIEIPYEKLRDDPVVQAAFQDLVYITTEESPHTTPQPAE